MKTCIVICMKPRTRAGTTTQTTAWARRKRSRKNPSRAAGKAKNWTRHTSWIWSYTASTGISRSQSTWPHSTAENTESTRQNTSKLSPICMQLSCSMGYWESTIRVPMNQAVEPSRGTTRCAMHTYSDTNPWWRRPKWKETWRAAQAIEESEKGKGETAKKK